MQNPADYVSAGPALQALNWPLGRSGRRSGCRPPSTRGPAHTASPSDPPSCVLLSCSTKYESFEAKRKLCNSYDLFLADERVLPSLPKLIGVPPLPCSPRPALPSASWVPTCRFASTRLAERSRSQRRAAALSAGSGQRERG